MRTDHTALPFALTARPADPHVGASLSNYERQIRRSSSALATWRSAVSKPSVNLP